MKKKNNNFIFFLIIFFLFFFFYFYILLKKKQSFFKNSNSNFETFVTFFTPYYTNILENENKIRKYVYLDVQKDKFYSQKISIGYDYVFLPDKKIMFLENIGKTFLTYTPYMNLSLSSYKNEDLMMQAIYEKKLDIGIISSSTLNNYYNNRDYIFKNLQMISTLFYSHFYLISYKDSKVRTFIDLFTKPIYLGIVHSDIRAIQDFNNLWNATVLQNRLYDGKIRYKPKIVFINEFEDVETYFKNKWIDAFFLVDTYPNIFIMKFLSSWKYFKPNLIPIVMKDEDMFLKQIGYLNKSSINIYKILNKNIRDQYDKNQKANSSNYLTYRYYNYFVCHKDLNFEIGYWFAKSIDQFMIKEQDVNLANKMIQLDQKKKDYEFLIWFFESFSRKELFDTSFLPIPIHPGASKYATEKGFITFNPSKSCAILAGVKECSDENLEPIIQTSM